MAMVELFAQAPRDVCETAYLRAIHNLAAPTVPVHLAALSIREHIEVAVQQPRVLARSVLMATGKANSPAEADMMLDATPVLKQALMSR